MHVFCCIVGLVLAMLAGVAGWKPICSIEVRLGWVSRLPFPRSTGLCVCLLSRRTKSTSARSNVLVAMHFYTPLLTVLSTFPDLGSGEADAVRARKAVQLAATQKRSDILDILFSGLTEDAATRLCLPMPSLPACGGDDDLYDDALAKREAWLREAQQYCKVCLMLCVVLDRI